MMETAVAEGVFATACLLAMIAFMPPLAQRLKIPYTVLLALMGMALGTVVYVIPTTPGVDASMSHLFDSLRIGGTDFLTLFLPILLFETSLSLDVRSLMEDLTAVLVLAIVAVIVTTLLAGAAVAAFAGVGIIGCLLLASIIATTDPIAVVAIFREVGAPHRLASLVEGESLLNDAAAIALFALLVSLVEFPTAVAFGPTALMFLWDFAGGGLFGIVMARLACIFLSRLDDTGPAEITLSVALAYLTYGVADHLLHVSGVVAVVAAGLVFGTIGRSRVSPQGWRSLAGIWGQLSFWASSLIFVLASMLVPENLATATWHDLVLLLALIAGATLARAIILFVLLPLLARLRLSLPINRNFRIVMLWGGLRGAVTLALALSVVGGPLPEEIRHMVGVVATGYVLFTLLVQGTTLRYLIRKLGLDQLLPVEAMLRSRALELAKTEVIEELRDATRTYRLDAAAAATVEQLDRERMAAPRRSSPLGDDMLREQLTTALATITSHEMELYLEQRARHLMARSSATRLIGEASQLLDALRVQGPTGYRNRVRLQGGLDRRTRLAATLQRWFGWQRGLERLLAERFETMLVRRYVLAELRLFNTRRVTGLFGERIAGISERMLEARELDVERGLEALRLQYPDYWTEIGKRYLDSVAVRLELEAYRHMVDEGLLTPTVHRTLTADLAAKQEALEDIPHLDLGLAVPQLLARLPWFQNLDAAELADLAKLLASRLALPGERLVARGETGVEMYFIASGAVEVMVPAGPIRLGTGDFFGEVAMLSHGQRVADVVALAYCQLLVLRRDAFDRFLDAHADLRMEIEAKARERMNPAPAETAAASIGFMEPQRST